MIRDKNVVELELAKVIYAAHPPREGLIWENLSPDVREWVLVQARAALKYLENIGVLELEDTRVR